MPEAMNIPVVDIGELGIDDDAEPSEMEWQRVGRELTDALKDIGFVYVSGHGIPQEQIDRVMNSGANFFDLAEEVKANYSFNHQTKEGHIALDQQRNGNNKNSCEYRECYDLKMIDDLPSEEVAPDFKNSIADFLDSCRKLTERILAATALGLDLERNFFTDAHKDMYNEKTPNVLRILHYPPVPKDLVENALRISAHNDWGTITFLFQDNVGGLDVRHNSGKWIKADPIPGTVLLNVGELLQFWTGNILKATEHRVLVPEDEILQQKTRRSIAYFINPDKHVLIQPFDGSTKKQPILSKDFLLNKYKETMRY